MKATMTRIVALMCAVLLVISLAACGEKAADKNGDADKTASSAAEVTTAPTTPADALVGSWEYQGGNYTYTFNEDGTGAYDVGSSVMKFTYEATDTTLSILYEGNTSPLKLDYVINGTVLNVKDSFGNDTLYNRK